MHLRRIAVEVFSVVLETHLGHQQIAFFRGLVLVVLEPVEAVELALSVAQNTARELVFIGFDAASAMKIVCECLLHVVVQRPSRLKLNAIVLLVHHLVLHLLVLQIEFLRGRLQQTVNVFGVFRYIFVKNLFFFYIFLFHKNKNLQIY